MNNSSKNSDHVAGKIPPQNIDAEKSLLGAILIDEEVIADVAEITKSIDFYDTAWSIKK